MIDREGSRSRLQCPPWPAPLHLLGGVLRWTALSWRDRLAVPKMARPIRAAQRGDVAGDGSETVEQWLVRHGQTPQLRELLWDPLALAALNQPSTLAAAAPFVRVLGEMFKSRSASAIVLPTRPLHEMYAEPA